MRDENETKIGRRAAMKRSLMVLGAAALAPTALGACGGEEAARGGVCGDVTLTPAQTQMRTTLNYVDSGPDATKHCTACALYTAGTPCGTCSVIQGPVAPAGTCTSFAPRPS